MIFKDFLCFFRIRLIIILVLLLSNVYMLVYPNKMFEYIINKYTNLLTYKANYDKIFLCVDFCARAYIYIIYKEI